MKRFLYAAGLPLFTFHIMTQAAFAVGPYLEVTAFPGYSETNKGALGDMGGNFGGGTLNSESGFSYDLRNTLGVRLEEWLMIGASYNYAKESSKRDVSSAAPSLNQKLTYSELGVTAGFFLGNVRLLGTFLFSGQKKRTSYAVDNTATVVSDVTTTNKNGHGFQIILGYTFDISSALKIGPSLVYRRVIYGKQSQENRTPGAPAQETYTDQAFSTGSIDAGLLPMVTLSLNLFGGEPSRSR